MIKKLVICFKYLNTLRPGLISLVDPNTYARQQLDLSLTSTRVSLVLTVDGPPATTVRLASSCKMIQIIKTQFSRRVKHQYELN